MPGLVPGIHVFRAASKTCMAGTSNTGNRTAFHMEGGKGRTPILVKFQMQPDPLAR